MIKIASEEAREILSHAGQALRALKTENIDLREKVAEYEKRERVTKLAGEMQRKGIRPDTTFEEKVDGLFSKTEHELDVIEEATHMGAPQVKVAELADRSGNPADAKSRFETAILEDTER